jgi:hypothetical protein
MEFSGALSKSTTARASGFVDRAQNLPTEVARIQTVPFPLGVKRTSDLWPDFKSRISVSLETAGKGKQKMEATYSNGYKSSVVGLDIDKIIGNYG